jgi:hypothetical protein
MTKLPAHVAVTGRVKDWLKDPESRLPVSCTVFHVKDSMEGKDGIEDSWIFTSRALRNAAGVAIDLSDLRPSGTSNGKGLVASGPCSFAAVYSGLNELLRRGGAFRNGAITLYLDYDHPDIEQYLDLSLDIIPWAKRAVYVDENLMQSPHIDKIVKRVRDGSIWLAKKSYDRQGRRLYSNVCMEILLLSRGTCLLSHGNLGSVTVSEIPQMFEKGMQFLCELHSKTGVGDSGIYLTPEEDRQVGFGVIGLSNLLALEHVKYADFVDALEKVLGYGKETPSEPAYAIACALLEGYSRAAIVARAHNMERAFTIAPTATCSYKYRDRDGYTTAPEISPVNCHPISKTLVRESETMPDVTYEYHPNCETTTDVSWNVQYRLMKAWQMLMNTTGLAHAISFNIWDKANLDKEFIQDWLKSPLLTTYYSLKTQQFALDKSQIALAGESCGLTPDMCTSCSE